MSRNQTNMNFNYNQETSPLDPSAKTIPPAAWTMLPHTELHIYGALYRSTPLVDRSDFLESNRMKILECFGIAPADEDSYILCGTFDFQLQITDPITGEVRVEDGTYATRGMKMIAIYPLSSSPPDSTSMTRPPSPISLSPTTTTSLTPPVSLLESSPYGHNGIPCTSSNSNECIHCYKYYCDVCGTRTNKYFTCCAGRQIIDPEQGRRMDSTSYAV